MDSSKLELTQTEASHAKLMRAIARSVNNTPLVLKGGTALLFGYGLDRFSEDLDFDTVLQQMQPDQRTLGMVFMRNSLFSSSPVYLHFPLWYQAEKNGLVDYNFGTGFMMLLQFKHLSTILCTVKAAF